MTKHNPPLVYIWRLTDDPSKYGTRAGQFIFTSPDGEIEVLPIWLTFPDTRAAKAYALMRGWRIVPLIDTPHTEPTEQGNQYIIPGCEKDKSRGPQQMDFF